MAITSFTYPQICKWYNSERRERKPAYINTQGSNNYIQLYDTSLNQFILDASNTSVSDKKEVVFFTYANGVKVKYVYYLDSETNDRINLRGTIGLYDDNDNVMTISGVTNPINTMFEVGKVYGDTVDNINIWYNPPQIAYSSSDYPNAARYMQHGSVIYAKNNASPYDAPVLSGEHQYDRAYFGIYWAYYELGSVSTELLYQRIINAMKEEGDGTPISPILPSEDTSGTGGGDVDNPNYDPFSDPINSPNVPSVSSLDTGFISAYNPTKAQLQEVASVMWTDNFIQELKKIWNSPIEGIVSLHMLPFTPPTYGYVNCKIGNYNTGISMKAIFSQYQKLQGGSLHVDERWCSALDYSPYTRAFIHIPFVGIQPINIDDVMNKTVTLEYIVDVLTGSGIAFLKCGDAVLHTYPCNMAMKIPFTMSDHQLLYQSLSNFAVATGKAVAAGGSSPSATAGAISSALNVVTSKHSTVQKSGVISSTYGMLDNFTAYIILHRPIQSLASDFGHFKGYPCNITYTLSSLSGYTEVEYAHLEGVTATDAEKEEIQSLLSQGVIL